jgi:hypothetical protein
MPRKDENGGYITPKIELDPYTQVVDRARQEVVMRIEAALVLPVGAIIELTEPNVDATVVGVRLLAGNERIPMRVCLDVEVPASYWDDKDDEQPPSRHDLRTPSA